MRVESIAEASDSALDLLLLQAVRARANTRRKGAKYFIMDIYFLMDEVMFRDADVLLRSKDAAEIVAPYLADVVL